MSDAVDTARIARDALELVCSGKDADAVACHYHPEFVDHVNGSRSMGTRAFESRLPSTKRCSKTCSSLSTIR